MKFEHTRVMNFDGAFRGMRNPLNSWDRSDSRNSIMLNYANSQIIGYDEKYEVGEKDLELAQKLIAGGSPHRKFLRQILVSVDITGPLYWWKEFDTYKVGTVANSTSTMHKLASTPITIDCFETDDYDPTAFGDYGDEFIDDVIAFLETMRKKYNDTKDKRIWKELIRWLPESWLQTRTITFNYEVIRQMCYWREGHKLSEWKSFIDWADTLPYAEELIFYAGKES